LQGAKHNACRENQSEDQWYYRDNNYLKYLWIYKVQRKICVTKFGVYNQMFFYYNMMKDLKTSSELMTQNH